MKKILSFLVVLTMILSCAAIPAMASQGGVTKLEDGTVIIDDAATAAFTFTGGATSGAWKIINNANAGYTTHDTADNKIHHTGKGAATSTVKVTPNTGVLTAGYYNVNWWNIPSVSGNGKAPASVSYTIAYEGGSKTATGTFNGQNGSNDWLLLVDKLYFSGNGQEYIEITAITSSTQGFGADAVKFVPVADESEDDGEDDSENGVTKLEDGTVIIDDAATAAFTFTGGATSGAWKIINNANAGYTTHDTADNKIHHTGKGAATSTVKVTPNTGVLTAGYYNVNWWNIPSVSGNGKAPASVSYTIAYEGGSKTATGTFDGATAENDWLSLKEKVYFNGNGQEYIEITATTAADQGFGADAVKFVPVSNAELGTSIRDLYATVTLGDGTTHRVDTYETIADGTTKYHIAGIPATAKSYTITCSAAADVATVKINDIEKTGANTTDPENYVAGKAEVYEICITNGTVTTDSLVIFNRTGDVVIDTGVDGEDTAEWVKTEDASDDHNWKRTVNAVVSGHDGLVGTDYHAGIGASCKWTPASGKIIAGKYKLEFYNVQNTNGSDGAEKVEIEIKTADGIKKVTISQKGTVAGWMNLGEYRFTGDGTDYVKATKISDNEDEYMRVDAIRFADPDIIVNDYGIINNGEEALSVTAGNFSGILTGYNLNPKSGVVANIILAKYDKATGQLIDIKYNDTNTEVKNNVDLSLRGTIEIATPIITVSETENIELRAFVWVKRNLTPLYEEVKISK